MAMKLKLDEAGHAVLSDGKPVYVHDDGKEIPFDAPATIDTISRLNREAKTHREGKEAAEKAAKAFEGLDAEKARAALDTVAKLDDKKLIDAGAVDKVKAETVAAYEEKLKAVEAKYQPVVQERDQFQAALVAEKIGGAFSRSRVIADKLAIPADLVQAKFGGRFKLEDGKVVGVNEAGETIYSRARPGEIADFDEALEIVIETYPHKDQILKGSGASGGGAKGGAGGGGKTMTRAAFAQLPPADQMKHMKGGGSVTD